MIPKDFSEPLGRQVPLPIDTLKPGAVAEMETGDRVEDPAVRTASFQKVISGERLERGARLSRDTRC